MKTSRLFTAATLAIALAACGDRADTARGVDHGETLLSVSAGGQAESRPDRAQFQAGIETFARSATNATKANGDKIDEIVSALRKLGVEEKDIQTRSVSVQRITWGDRRGQYQAANVVEVTLRDPDRAAAAITAVTEAGANILSGPNLSMTDPEATANLAYADAYKAARKRADAYAAAAGMEVSRVLYIRDAGGQQGDHWLRGAQAANDAVAESVATVAPPPPVAMPMPQQGNAGMMVGTTRSQVYIQVDYALRPK